MADDIQDFSYLSFEERIHVQDQAARARHKDYDDVLSQSHDLDDRTKKDLFGGFDHASGGDFAEHCYRALSDRRDRQLERELHVESVLGEDGPAETVRESNVSADSSGPGPSFANARGSSGTEETATLPDAKEVFPE